MPPRRLSSPPSNGTDANEYTSEKKLGISGILPRIPHLPFPSPSPGPGSRLLVDCVGVVAFFPALFGFGTSKICKVDLSDVQARRSPEGLKAREKMVAGSMPRRSSAILAQLDVEKTRIIVP
jgi:hypothetical protein